MERNSHNHVVSAECRKCINPEWYLEVSDNAPEVQGCGLCWECCAKIDADFEALLEELGL